MRLASVLPCDGDSQPFSVAREQVQESIWVCLKTFGHFGKSVEAETKVQDVNRQMGIYLENGADGLVISVFVFS